MLSVVEVLELIDESERLASAKRFPDLREFLRSNDPATVRNDPLLRYYEMLAVLRTGDLAEAAVLATSAGDFFGGHRGSAVYGRYLNLLGICLTHTGRVGLANSVFGEAYATAIDSGNLLLAADATMNAGVVADIQGRWADAVAAHVRAWALYAELGDGEMVAACHHNLGIAYRQVGALRNAQSHFEQAADVRRDHPSRLGTIATALETALLYVQLGDADLAESIARTAARDLMKLRNVYLAAEALRVMAIARHRQGDTIVAARLLERALRKAVATENVLLEAECAEHLGRLHSTNNPGRSTEMRIRAKKLYRQMGAVSRGDILDRLLGDGGNSPVGLQLNYRVPKDGE